MSDAAAGQCPPRAPGLGALGGDGAKTVQIGTGSRFTAESGVSGDDDIACSGARPATNNAQAAPPPGWPEPVTRIPVDT